MKNIKNYLNRYKSAQDTFKDALYVFGKNQFA